MSAFILSNAHINALLTLAAPRYPGDGASYRWQGQSHYFGGNTHEIAQKLLDQNYRSVNYRYSEEGDAPRFYMDPTVGGYSPLELLNACRCYEYQSCETPDWQETEAHAILHALQARAIHQAIDAEAEAKGHNTARGWGINDSEAGKKYETNPLINLTGLMSAHGC